MLSWDEFNKEESAPSVPVVAQVAAQLTAQLAAQIATHTSAILAEKGVELGAVPAPAVAITASPISTVLPTGTLARTSAATGNVHPFIALSSIH